MSKRFYVEITENGHSYDQVCTMSWEIEINNTGKIMSVCKN